jgi:glycosyltransferase involved in cell wall biosynthesis
VTPRVSVLMATWNRARFLPDAIEGVLAQTMPDFELIVSDNASTDETRELVDRYAQRDPRVRYFCNDTNVGLTRNFNLCYLRSSEDVPFWVAHPSDDRWHPQFLERTVGVMDAHPDVALVHTDAFRTDSGGEVINRWSDLWRYLPPPGKHRALRELIRDCYICYPTALARRRAVEELYPRPHGELWDPQFTPVMDWSFYLGFMARGALAYYLDEPLAYFRKHAGALTMQANVVPLLREEIRLLDETFAEVCPPTLAGERRRAIQDRAASLGFELLQHGAADEAGAALDTARDGDRRLDVLVARAISRLPMSQTLRSGLWRVAWAASALVRSRLAPVGTA